MLKSNEIMTKTVEEQIPVTSGDMLPAGVKESEKAVSRAASTACIAKLYITYPDGSTRQGTGFLYANSALATAGHCIYDPRYGGRAKTIKVVFPSGTYYSSAIYAPDEWLRTTVSTMASQWMYDYGVINLNETPGRTLGVLDYLIASDGQLQNAEITVSGYLEYRTTLSTTVGTIDRATTYDVGYTAALGFGKSGSPVILSSNGMFIAIGNYDADSNYEYPTGARITFDVADFLDLHQ